MKERLKQHVERVFAYTPNTKRIMELKQEIYQNLLDKYEDKLSEGKSEQEAYDAAVSSIGDIRQVIDDILREDGIEPGSTEPYQWYSYTKEEIEADRKKSGTYLTIAVVLYITCVIPVILFDEWFDSDMGIILMFAMIATATGLLIYRNSTKIDIPKQNAGQSMGQNMSQGMAGNVPGQGASGGIYYGNVNGVMDTPRNRKLREVRKTINRVISIMTVVVYFIVSFATMAWYITWLIFLIGPAVENIVKAVFELMEDEV